MNVGGFKNRLFSFSRFWTGIQTLLQIHKHFDIVASAPTLTEVVPPPPPDPARLATDAGPHLLGLRKKEGRKQG
jgi:hypothetical protein